MIQQYAPGRIVVARGETEMRFLPTGDIEEFLCGPIRVNCCAGTAKDASPAQIWLRLYGGDGGVAHVYPLWGAASDGQLYVGERRLTMSGRAGGVEYEVSFCLPEENAWTWSVTLGQADVTADLIYGQDIGVAARGAILNNELYAAQYLGHSVYQAACGYAVCSRQNMPQEGRNPLLQQGMLRGEAVGYSTDAMQFFGASYKESDRPQLLYGNLPCENLQFELSYTALQTARFPLRGGEELIFYGMFAPHHPGKVTGPANAEPLLETLREAERGIAELLPRKAPALKREFGGPYASPDLTSGQVDALWPERRLEERRDGVLLSFFAEEHEHVVLKAKELLCERSHAHILTTAVDPRRLGKPLLTTTNAMYGLFNAQTAVGNTSLHKLISAPRGLLNQTKGTGQRLYVRVGGQYRLLTLPAAYEMGVSHARWRYLMPDGGALTVTAFVAADDADIVLDIESDTPRDLLLATQLVMGEQEFEQPLEIERLGGALRVRMSAEGRAACPYPGLHYDIRAGSEDVRLSDDRVFFEDGAPRNATLLTLAADGASRLRVVIHAALEEGEPTAPRLWDFEEQRRKFRALYDDMTGGALLAIDPANPQARRVAKLNEILWWYAHNALVHFAAPHGLEQPGGAAWGTRDVCQGSFEFLMTTGHYDLTRDMLLRLFAHQERAAGEWPQWFMFDRYRGRAGERHGDVVFWPLKCVAEYLLATGDGDILREELPYSDSDASEPLLTHVKRAAGQFRLRFLPGTALLSYAGGDWDDTLQPADPRDRERLVSAWTQALGIQAAELLARAFEAADRAFSSEMQKTARDMREAFDRHLIIDGTIPGFLYREADGSFRPMLHPSAETFGIRRRLLPLTRSVIAGIVSTEQARANLDAARAHLRFPDGYRLMDHPAPYDGGVPRLFLRAEQAANVGREISLQYVHAHIRTLEALSALGDADELWRELFTIHPIDIAEEVPRALPRQSNLYFSSSDPDFPDRYAFAEGFERLRAGQVAVKGGWRLYSSGPGIYIRRLIADALGIRFDRDGLIVDPVLPASLDGLWFSFACLGRRLTFRYHIDGPAVARLSTDGVDIPSTRVGHPYRIGGLHSKRQSLPPDGATVDVWMR